jgi:hypothetical protein
MNIDRVYLCLFSASCFFLTSWVLLLVLACVVEFRREWSASSS